MMMFLQQLSESLQLLYSGTRSSYAIGSKGNTKDQEKALHSGCISYSASQDTGQQFYSTAVV